MKDGNEDDTRRRIHLVRHGHVDYFDERGQPVNPKTVGLSEEGRRQADALADVLRPVPLDRAIFSGLTRTRQTAEILVDGRGLDLGEDPGFLEIRAGRFRDLPPGAAPEMIADAYRPAGEGGATFLGGETFDAFERRVLGAFERLLADRSWHSLLLVAHDAVNRVILCRALGCGLRGLAMIEQDLACLNVLDVEGRAEGLRTYVRAVNITPYDAAKVAIRSTGMERIAAQYVPRCGA